jgi:hypothetical protein
LSASADLKSKRKVKRLSLPYFDHSINQTAAKLSIRTTALAYLAFEMGSRQASLLCID